jgi:hypothetical protein
MVHVTRERLARRCDTRSLARTDHRKKKSASALFFFFVDISSLWISPVLLAFSEYNSAVIFLA